MSVVICGVSELRLNNEVFICGVSECCKCLCLSVVYLSRD